MTERSKKVASATGQQQEAVARAAAACHSRMCMNIVALLLLYPCNGPHNLKHEGTPASTTLQPRLSPSRQRAVSSGGIMVADGGCAAAAAADAEAATTKAAAAAAAAAVTAANSRAMGLSAASTH